MRSCRSVWFPLAGGFLFLVDQILKVTARTNSDFSAVWQGLVGWEYFANPGIAFSLPFPNTLLIVGTPVVLLLLLFLYTRQEDKASRFSFGLLLIIFGALSNWIDRLLFEATIDYLRILTGIINLADVMIIGGAVLLVSRPKIDA